MPELCGDVNDKLGEIVDPAKGVKEYWEMPTAIVKAATFNWASRGTGTVMWERWKCPDFASRRRVNE
jgi:hypothetical protein